MACRYCASERAPSRVRRTRLRSVSSARNALEQSVFFWRNRSSAAAPFSPRRIPRYAEVRGNPTKEHDLALRRRRANLMRRKVSASVMRYDRKLLSLRRRNSKRTKAMNEMQKRAIIIGVFSFALSCDGFASGTAVSDSANAFASNPCWTLQECQSLQSRLLARITRVNARIEKLTPVIPVSDPSTWQNSYKAVDGAIWSDMVQSDVWGPIRNCLIRHDVDGTPIYDSISNAVCQKDASGKILGTSADGSTVTDSDAIRVCKQMGGNLPTVQDFDNFKNSPNDQQQKALNDVVFTTSLYQGQEVQYWEDGTITSARGYHGAFRCISRQR